MESTRPTRIQQLFTPLRELIYDNLPYISGTLPLPASCFSLFYRIAEGGPDARCIDLSNATFDELERLVKACEPTSDIKKNKKSKTDAPAKMDLGSFAPLLVPSQTSLVKIIRDYHFGGDKSRQRLKIVLQELNVYSKGSSSKPRVQVPPGQCKLGSLIIIFPTPHEGGVFSLRSRTTSHEWSFDPSPETSNTTLKPSIGYVVLLEDVEHEIAPITSGHCVTLTYNLYAENDDGPVSMMDQDVSESVPPLSNERAIHNAFVTLLENPELLAEDGGTLAFGLSHAYLFKKDFKHVYDALKGSDAALYRTLRGLGFESVLRMYYHEWYPDSISKGSLNGYAGIFDKTVDFSDAYCGSSVNILGFVENHGLLARTDDTFGYEEGVEMLHWVTPVTTFNPRRAHSRHQ